jgi:predicted Zn-dependent peptidase
LEEERGSQDDIDNVIHEKLNSFLCKGPYAKPILGTKESIMSMTLEEVQEFYNYYYKPSRMLMTVTGDHLANDTISGFFGGDTNSFKKSERAPNVNLKRKRLVIPTAVKQARVFISYNGFPVKSKHSLPLHFMSKFFSNGVDTRLFEELRQKRGLCYGVGSYVVLEKDIGWYVLSTRTAEENVSQCVKLLDKEVKKLLEDGPTEEEMFRAKNKYISEIYGFIETSYGLNAVLESKFFNNLPSLETSISRIKNMSKGKIMSTCRDVFIKDNRKVFICTPKGDE